MLLTWGAMPPVLPCHFSLFLKQLVIFSLIYTCCNNWLHLNWYCFWSSDNMSGECFCAGYAHIFVLLCQVYLLGEILVFLCHCNLNFFLFFISQWSERLQKDAKNYIKTWASKFCGSCQRSFQVWVRFEAYLCKTMATHNPRIAITNVVNPDFKVHRLLCLTISWSFCKYSLEVLISVG